MKTGIYQIRNLANGKRYIGSAAGKGFSNRWNLHIKTLNNKCHYNSKLQNAWNKYGKENFIFEILEECIPDKCIEREQYYLDVLLYANKNDDRFFKLGYNILRVAGSVYGYRHTEETKKKIINNRKPYTSGEDHHSFGKRHTIESRRRMSDAQKGNHIGEKNNFYNKQHSNQTRRKMSLKKRKTTPQQDIEICQRIANGEKQKTLALEFGVDPSVISCIKRGVKRYAS